MKKIILLGLLIPSLCFSQKLKLNPNANIDTLYFDLVISDKVSTEYAQEIKERTTQVINELNVEGERAFYIKQQSGAKENVLTLNVDSISIATKQEQRSAMTSTLLGAVLLPTIMVAAEMELILLFWFRSYNRIHYKLSLSSNLKSSKYKRPMKGMFSTKAGWFREKDKNVIRTFDNYAVVLDRLLYNTHYRYQRKKK